MGVNRHVAAIASQLYGLLVITSDRTVIVTAIGLQNVTKQPPAAVKQRS